jgi:cold shock CspA family protein
MSEQELRKGETLLAAFVADLPEPVVLTHEWRPPATLEFSLLIGGQPRVRGLRDEAHRGSVDVVTDLVSCLDDIQQSVIEDGVGRAWPACPFHEHHPLQATRDGWLCTAAVSSDPAEETEDLAVLTWAYGTLGPRGASRPLAAADHVIRWYRPDWGWGIIADIDGDVWFHLSSFKEPGPATVSDGADVNYSVGAPMGSSEPSCATRSASCSKASSTGVSASGEPLCAEWLARTVRAYVKAGAPAKKGSCHLFRHSAATLMLDGGADVRYVAEYLGHESLESTKIDTRVSVEKLRAVHRSHPPGRELSKLCRAARNVTGLG